MSLTARRLKPFLDRVLVEKIVAPTRTAAGILLPETTTKLNSGVVIATGTGARTQDGGIIPVSVKEGDKVLLPEFGGTQIVLGDKEFSLYHNDDLLGILEE
jgi:chaperonin GroES